MIKIKVYTKEDTEGGYDGTVLTHLRPRAYMTGWSFDQLLKYAKEELEWADIKEEDVTGFEIFNKEEHWTDFVERPTSKSIYQVRIIGANYSRDWYANSPKEAIKLEQWKRREDGLKFYPMRDFEAIEIK